MSAKQIERKQGGWAGPALFTAVAVALLVFFWWFL